MVQDLPGDSQTGPPSANPDRQDVEATTTGWHTRLRVFGHRVLRRVVWSSLVVLVLLAVWGAHDLDRSVRRARHDGETWSQLETWPSNVEGTVEDTGDDAGDDDADDGAAARETAREAKVRASLEERAVVVLRLRDLKVPVRDVMPEDLRNSFGDGRSGGRSHHAIDIVAPNGTPVLAADDGMITTKAAGGLGGKHLFQVDETATFVYYYAHLDGWSWGLEEGDRVRRGDVLGYVGTTGNAPVDAPHLHFAIYKVVPGRRGPGVPINPWRVLAPEPE